MIKNKLFHNRVIELLLISLPILLISGPFLSDLVISFLSIYFFCFILKEKTFYKFFNNKISIFFFSFCCLIIVSSLVSQNIILSFESSLFYFRFGLFTLFVVYYLKKNSLVINKLFYALLFCFIILIIDSIFQYIFEFNILNIKIDPTKRVSSFFGSELILGSYLSRLFPVLAAFYFFKNKNKINIKLNIIMILFLEFVIILSGERTAFFLFNFTIILFLIFLNIKTHIKFLTFGATIVSLLIVFVTDSKIKKRLFDQTLHQIGISSNQNDIYIFSKQHNHHYISAAKMFLDNPIIGIGPKNFRKICDDPRYKVSELSCSTHPHNTYLQLLSETGFLGFLIIFLFFLYLLYVLIVNLLTQIFKKKNKLNNFQICLLISLVLSLWPLVPNGNFFNNWLSIVYFFPAGFLIWSFKIIK